MTNQNKVLVLGGTGKTGRRVVERLQARNVPVHIGSRSADLPFDWEDDKTWSPVLKGISAVYIAFQPDLAIPAAVAIIQKFTDLAVTSGVKRLVLLSGRGEAEAERCEQIVQNSGVEWTIVRASFFNQNFNEGMLFDSVMSNEFVLPVGDIGEPFIDVDDIAEVATVALVEDGHVGQLYEVTGPSLLTFKDAVEAIAQASGRSIKYVQVPIEVYTQALREMGQPEDVIWLIEYLFTTVLDGRNESVSDGVQRALGRESRSFTDYVRDTVKTGIWNTQPVQG